jgi:hypothetical protein
MALGVGVRVGPFYAFTAGGGSLTRAALAWWLWPFYAMWLILRFYWWLLVNVVMLVVWVVTVAIPAVAAAVRRVKARRALQAGTTPGPRDWSPPSAPEGPAV